MLVATIRMLKIELEDAGGAEICREVSYPPHHTPSTFNAYLHHPTSEPQSLI
jgi:hypothetical protein